MPDPIKESQRQWLQSAMVNLRTMDNGNRTPATGEEDALKMIDMLEKARDAASPEAVKKGEKLLKQAQAVSEPRPLRELRKRIERLYRISEQMTGLELYDGGLPEMSAEVAGNIDALQTVWNETEGAPLKLGKMAVLTPGTSFKRKGLRLGTSRTDKRRAKN